MTRKEYYDLVRKFHMKRNYNNTIECMVVGHTITSPWEVESLEEIPSEQDARNEKENVYKTKEVLPSGAIRYCLYPVNPWKGGVCRRVLGNVRHGYYIDGVIYDG